jgi:hypothetical protein
MRDFTESLLSNYRKKIIHYLAKENLFTDSLDIAQHEPTTDFINTTKNRIDRLRAANKINDKEKAEIVHVIGLAWNDFYQAFYIQNKVTKDTSALAYFREENEKVMDLGGYACGQALIQIAMTRLLNNLKNIQDNPELNMTIIANVLGAFVAYCPRIDTSPFSVRFFAFKLELLHCLEKEKLPVKRLLSKWMKH